MPGWSFPSGFEHASYRLLNGRIILPDRTLDGLVDIEQGQIREVADSSAGRANDLPTIDLDGRNLSPGYIDMHVHGGGGADFMDLSTDAFETAIRCHLRHGVTSIVPTNSVATHEQTMAFLELARTFHRKPPGPENGLGRVIGSHLYGPFFADEKIGLHPRLAKPPTQVEFLQYVSHADHLLVATCAPELDGAADFYRAAASAGIRLNAGHSNATWAEMRLAYDLGVRHIDHFFCAMSNYVSTRSRVGTPMQGGMMEFALASPDMTTELIADGRHLDPDLMRFAIRMFGVDRTAVVSDSSRAVDMSAGEFIFGPPDIGTRFRSNGEVGVTLDGKGLASSIRGLDFMVRHLVNAVGLEIYDAVRMATLTPAKILGVDRQFGSIQQGKVADLLILNDLLEVDAVVVGGVPARLGK